MRAKFIGTDWVLDHGETYWVSEELRENGEVWIHAYDLRSKRLVRTIQYLSEWECSLWWSFEDIPDEVSCAVPMKPVVACTGCSSCSELMETGFTGKIRYFCQLFSSEENPVEVEPGDGCTLGTPGEKVKASVLYDVQLGNDAAVNGYPE